MGCAPTRSADTGSSQTRDGGAWQNHHGKNSALVLRPADAIETNVAWKMALENTHTPTALLLSRQNIPDLPSKSGRYQEAMGAEKGGYIVTKDEGEIDIVLVANGSEVSTLIDGAKLLNDKKGLKIQVSSIISEGLFREQDSAYQEKVIPSNKPVFGLTAGLPVTLQGLVCPKGKVFGLESFGFSAPAKVLDEKLGFTAENVFIKVEKYLDDYKK